ncbi:MAG: hypothetical protein MZV70_72865 [Desulfobacterales bacterium]|nr:hypothetical protein [Desulfobacterales bacterium]
MDVIVIGVKNYSLDAIARLIKANAREDVIIVSMANGMDNQADPAQILFSGDLLHCQLQCLDGSSGYGGLSEERAACPRYTG